MDRARPFPVGWRGCCNECIFFLLLRIQACIHQDLVSLDIDLRFDLAYLGFARSPDRLQDRLQAHLNLL